MSKPQVDKRFIVNLQGKEFVTYEGLLDLAHQTGLQSIETEILQFPTDENNNTCIVKAVCKTDKGEYHGIGDASPMSVNRMILPHLIRMAETRAKARAMRDLTNVGMTAIEELGGDDAEPTKPANKAVEKICSDCGVDVQDKVFNFSMNKYNKPLCFDCQKKQ